MAVNFSIFKKEKKKKWKKKWLKKKKKAEKEIETKKIEAKNEDPSQEVPVSSYAYLHSWPFIQNPVTVDVFI